MFAKYFMSIGLKSFSQCLLLNYFRSHLNELNKEDWNLFKTRVNWGWRVKSKYKYIKKGFSRHPLVLEEKHKKQIDFFLSIVFDWKIIFLLEKTIEF